MAIVISNTKQNFERLKLEGKVEILNSKEDHEKSRELTKRLLEIRKDYIRKSQLSELSASKVFIF